MADRHDATPSPGLRGLGWVRWRAFASGFRPVEYELKRSLPRDVNPTWVRDRT